MNNNFDISLFIKAGIITCFFLLCGLTNQSFAQSWSFDATVAKAYDQVLNLHFEEARETLPNPQTAEELYVISLAETLELFITENREDYDSYFKAYENRLDKRTKSSLAEDLFLQAEMRFQWACVYMKFGHEFDAAWNLRQCYEAVQDCKKKFPKFEPIKKTSGLLQIIIGSVPEKYNWVLGLLNMEGSIQGGLEELESIRKPGQALKTEADILYALIQGYMLQQPSTGIATLKDLQQQFPENKLVYFLGAALCIKNSQSREALEMLNKLEQLDNPTFLTYAYYLKGEVYLHKGEYFNAIAAYRWFINSFKGQDYIKDAYYKIGVCYWLNGNTSDALEIFKTAKTKGREVVEADNYASKSLADDELPNIKLTKVRYATDGGFYKEAKDLIASIKPADLATKRDQVEFLYRKARLAHKNNELPTATDLYQQVIDSAGDEPWYFAPNASLQLGYLALAKGDTIGAKRFFERALSYKKHAYKNSIDSKAKSGLDQLKSRR